MLTYEYTIYRPGSSEDIVATFSTNEPLAHIEAGHSLLLESDRFSTRAGFHQVIHHVETYLSTRGGLVDGIRVSVFLREEDRAKILLR